MGAVGTGLISDIWHRKESSFGVKNAEQLELPVSIPELTEEQKQRNIQKYMERHGMADNSGYIR